MIRYLLDTNIISEPAKSEPSDVVVTRVRDHIGEVALPSIAWHELMYGVQRMDEGRRRSYLLDYLQDVVRPSMPILPYDAPAARWHGRARAKLEQKGLSMPFADGQIAAIAGVGNLTVVTDNISDFRPFANLDRGIRVENWFSK